MPYNTENQALYLQVFDLLENSKSMRNLAIEQQDEIYQETLSFSDEELKNFILLLEQEKTETAAAQQELEKNTESLIADCFGELRMSKTKIMQNATSDQNALVTAQEQENADQIINQL